jgi:Uma2 family endonuclease
MSLVNTRTAETIFSAAEHLPDGATLIVSQVAWDEYERLLTGLREHPSLRVSYDCGKLEIVSPSSRHERVARFIDGLVREFARVHKRTVEMLGQTTWKRQALHKGVEPDCCYYTLNADRIIGRDDLDLKSDPPPDIAVEVDLTHPSLRKLPIYAALAVPEIWRFDGKTVRIYKLEGAKYSETSESRFLPGLTGVILGESIERSMAEGQTKALAEFSRRVRRRK